MHPSNTLSPDEINSGFRLLFDGFTTDGWRGYRQTAIFPQWRVTDNALMFHPDPEGGYGHDIITVEQFKNFELRIDWKLWEVGNSGILFHVHESADAPFKTGLEFQLLDNQRHGDARNGPDRQAGACYGLYEPVEDATAPIGTWNRVRILVDGDRVEHWMNDRLICQYVIGSDDWNRRVNSTKFREFPEFALRREGHICLQDHRDPVAFQNIRIRAWS